MACLLLIQDCNEEKQIFYEHVQKGIILPLLYPTMGPDTILFSATTGGLLRPWNFTLVDLDESLLSFICKTNYFCILHLSFPATSQILLPQSHSPLYWFFTNAL